MRGSATHVNVHASCVAIGAKGVLLLGASGAGKSDLALRLIDGGAKLVADDRCEFFVRGGKLHVRPPARIAGLMELRGIGIVALPYARSVAVAMAVRLGQNRERLPKPAFYAPPAPLEALTPVPLIMVNGRNAAAAPRIRAALAAFSAESFRDTFNPE
jgi:serine kinase of HPr protein (carbohydrate metabolism regulator)